MRKAILNALASLAVLLLGGTAIAAEPITVPSNRPELFVDDFLIDSQQGLVRTLHQPHKDFDGRQPIISSRPTTTLLALGSIVFDPKLGKYVAFTREHSSGESYRLTSKDGLNWDETRYDKLSRVSFPRDVQPEPNARGTPSLDLFSCYYNKDDREFPYQGWLYYANVGLDREGVYFVRSRDGLMWERGRQVVDAYAGTGDTSSRTISQDGKTVSGPGDVTVFSYDEVQNRFLGIFKFYDPRDVGDGSSLRSRAYMFLDAIDQPVDITKIKRIALLPPAADRDGDAKYDEYYASTAWRYGSLWLGGLKIFHGKGNYPYSAAGSAFLKLVASRDGLNWHKVPFLNDNGIPEVFIPNGPEGGNNANNDGGYMTEFSTGPLRVGNELVYYYGASSYGKNHPKGKRITGGGIFRARLRIDGFVSVDAGTLTTRPLRFEGSDLHVNSVGSVTVQRISDDDQLLNSATLEGDSIDHVVLFAGKSLRQIAPAGELRLRFTVQPGGHLYSFTIR